MARDLAKETADERGLARGGFRRGGLRAPPAHLHRGVGYGRDAHRRFHPSPPCCPTIDVVPSCADAVFAANMPYVPSGPNCRECASTTSFIRRLSEALENIEAGFGSAFPVGKTCLPNAFLDLRFLMTRFDPSNDVHRAMQGNFCKMFGDRL